MPGESSSWGHGGSLAPYAQYYKANDIKKNGIIMYAIDMGVGGCTPNGSQWYIKWTVHLKKIKK